MMTKTYSELIKLKTFEERFKYLKLSGRVGNSTFGYDRYLNQSFYKSKEWLSTRDKIIVRDNACDLGVPGNDIYNNIMVHHINPITPEDIKTKSAKLFDPENLISTRKRTHDAIHYGDVKVLTDSLKERRQNDTIPWRE